MVTRSTMQLLSYLPYLLPLCVLVNAQDTDINLVKYTVETANVCLYYLYFFFTKERVAFRFRSTWAFSLILPTFSKLLSHRTEQLRASLLKQEISLTRTVCCCCCFLTTFFLTMFQKLVVPRPLLSPAARAQVLSSWQQLTQTRPLPSIPLKLKSVISSVEISLLGPMAL